MKYLTKNKYWKINKEYNKEKLLYLLVDRPYEIDSIYFFWLKSKNEYHREYDLPAVVYNNGNIWWYKNNTHYSRKNNKPIIIFSNGKQYPNYIK